MTNKKYSLELSKIRMQQHFDWFDQKFKESRQHIQKTLQIKLAYAWKHYKINKARKIKEEEERQKKLAEIAE